MISGINVARYFFGIYSDMILTFLFEILPAAGVRLPACRRILVRKPKLTRNLPPCTTPLIISRLAVLVYVEPFFFDALVDPDADQLVYRLVKHIGNDGTEHDGYERREDLYPQLMPVAVQRALLRRPSPGDVAGSEDAGQDGADDTADAVHAECVQCVVILELRFDDGHHEEADDRRNQSDKERTQ